VPGHPHKDREFGGHLIVMPAPVRAFGMAAPHRVSDMLEHPELLRRHHLLCAIAERALLEALPCLNGSLTGGRRGITNLWEAGNWGVHEDRTPRGPKEARDKSVHVHLFGRSPLEPAGTPAQRRLHWGWGEAPWFPRYAETPYTTRPSKKRWVIPEPFRPDERALLRARIAALFKQIEGAKSRPTRCV
jgi:hypothetical protein